MLTISLEIGSSAVKLAAASFDPDSPEAVSILAIEEEPLTNNCVRFGRIQNVEDVKEQTLAALERLAARPELKEYDIKGVYASLGGRSLMSYTKSASLEMPDERLIDEDIIERLRNDATADIPDSKEVLEIIPLGFRVNGISTPRPIGAYGSRIEASFTVVVCAPQNSLNISRVVEERLKLKICDWVVRPLAVADATLTVDDTKPGCMLVDFGAETTTVAIFKDQALRYVSTIPLGSAHITRDLASVLGITEDKAEAIKMRAANAYMGKQSTSPDQIEIDAITQARVYEIVSNVAANIEYAGFKAADLRSGVVITGRGSKLRNMAQVVKDLCGMEVRTATLTSAIKIADASITPSDNTDIISVAYASTRIAQDEDVLPSAEPQPLPEPVHPQPEPEPEQPAQAIPVDEEPGYDIPDDHKLYVPEETAYSQPAASIDDDDPSLLSDDPEDSDDDNRPGNEPRKRSANAPKRKGIGFFNRTLANIMGKAANLIDNESEGQDID